MKETKQCREFGPNVSQQGSVSVDHPSIGERTNMIQENGLSDLVSQT